MRLWEVKQSQWRGGVWRDPDSGVCWLVAAGLAKGDHRDWDDFYEKVGRADVAGALDRWLPTERDVRLLKQETAARLRTDWELGIQAEARDALARIGGGGETRFDVHHPVNAERRMATVEVKVACVRDDDYLADELVVEISEVGEHVGSNLACSW